eukprot:4283594-Prymnesium_polylepis.1
MHWRCLGDGGGFRKRGAQLKAQQCRPAALCASGEDAQVWVDGSHDLWFRPLRHTWGRVTSSLGLAAPPPIMQHAQATRPRPRSV